MGEKYRVIKLTMNFASNAAKIASCSSCFNNHCQFQLENRHEGIEFKKKKQEDNYSLPLLELKMWSAHIICDSGGNTVV